jgi:hypothetical protein
VDVNVDVNNMNKNVHVNNPEQVLLSQVVVVNNVNVDHVDVDVNTETLENSSFAGVMQSFAGMVHNEDTTWNICQIPNSLDLISIFLYSILRD